MSCQLAIRWPRLRFRGRPARLHAGCFVRSLLFALFIAGQPGPAFAQEADVPAVICGSFEHSGYGPYDYTDPRSRRENLPVVERFHFNSDVYSLKRGMTGRIIGDLEYTLNAFPNHHLALDAIARLHEQRGMERLPYGRWPLQCWFERASQFTPEDGMVPLIRGVHLFRSGKTGEAEEYLARAVELMPQSAEAHYNLGLLHVRLREYGAAREHAQKAYALGHPLPGLRDQLQAQGQWDSEE